MLGTASPPEICDVRAQTMKTFLPLSVLVLVGCATSWPVYHDHLSRSDISREETTPLSLKVAVKAAPESEFRRGWSVPPQDDWIKQDMQGSVSNLVHDLRQTGLFSVVVPWTPTAQFDLLVESRRACGVIRCLTPFVCRPFTLYIFSGESSFKRMYEFRFVSPDGATRLDFNRVYRGTYYAPSILLLPFLSWQQRTTQSDLLRQDLIPMREQIKELGRTQRSPNKPSDATSQ